MMKEITKNQQVSVGTASLVGPLWFIGWLFSVGFVKLSFWKTVSVLVIGHYYLGSTLAL